MVLGACATAGAIIGDSIGYAIGRKGGRPLLAWLGRKFPKHFGEEHIAMAERSFEKWGMWAVFFGRFVALLRIFAGPLAGVLQMPYWKFLIANVLGGILWAGGTTAVIYYVGVVAESWLKRFSWLGLVLAVLIGLTSMLVLQAQGRRSAADSADGGRPATRRRTQAAAREPEPVARPPTEQRSCGAVGPAAPRSAQAWCAALCAFASSTYIAAFRVMPSRSSSVSSRLTFAGTPATSEPGGTCMPCGTSACAATSEPAPITAPLSTVAPMPIRQSSSTVQPCTTALWPTETRSPIETGKPGSTWSVQLSWTLLSAPSDDRPAVGAQHRRVPDARAGGQGHVADHDRRGRGEGRPRRCSASCRRCP